MSVWLLEWRSRCLKKLRLAQYWRCWWYFRRRLRTSIRGVTAAKHGKYAIALKELRPLALKGHARAQYNLGFMYDEGRGVPLSRIEAAKWYRKAAEQGYAKAQRSLGLKYEYGQGVPRDNVLAHMWFSLSASNGDKFATRSRNEITKHMPPVQVAKAQKLARKWLQKHKRK